MKEGRKPEYRRKPLATSFRKCHILKAENNSSPNWDSNPHSSIGGRSGKLTCWSLHQAVGDLQPVNRYCHFKATHLVKPILRTLHTSNKVYRKSDQAHLFIYIIKNTWDNWYRWKLCETIDKGSNHTIKLISIRIASVKTTRTTAGCVWSVWTFVVCWLVAYRPSNMRVYLRDGSAQTILRAATLR